MHEIPTFTGMTNFAGMTNINMPIEKTCPTGCGVNGKICETECYPVLDPSNTTDGLFELKQMTLMETSGGAPDIIMTPFGQRPPVGTRSPVDRDDPSTPAMNESEIDSFVANQTAVKSGRRDGIFRSSSAPYKWFAWELSDAARIAFNKFDPNYHLTGLASIGIELTIKEVLSLARCKELQLGKADIACKEGLCPVEMEDGTFKDGTYLFPRDPDRLEEIIAVLKDNNVALDITPERRQELIKHLNALKTASEEASDSWWKSVLLGAISNVLPLGALFFFLHWRSDRKADRRHAELMEGKKVENALETYSRNITEEARRGELGPYIGRHDFLYRILEIVTRREKPNPLVTAPSGRGKTTAIEGLAQMLVNGSIDPQILERFPSLKNAEIREVNLTRMEGGTGRRGDFEARWTALIDEAVALRKQGRNIWLAIDEAHLMVTAGAASETPGLGQKAKADLLKSGIPFIAMTTTNEAAIVLRDPAFGSRFERLVMEDLSLGEVTKIVKGKLSLEEGHYKIRIADGVVEKILEGSPERISDVRSFVSRAANMVSWFVFKYPQERVLEPRHVEEWLQERPPRTEAGGIPDIIAPLLGGRPVTIRDLMDAAVKVAPGSDLSTEAVRVRKEVEKARGALRRLEEAREALETAKRAVRRAEKR